MNYIATISPEHNVVILDISSLYSEETDIQNITLDVSINGDDDIFKNFIDSTTDYPVSHLFVNGVRFNSETCNKFVSDIHPYIFSFRIDTDSENFATGDISVAINAIKKNNNSVKIDTITIHVSDSDIQELDDVSYEANQLDSKLESYMLIRTNPKLSGNIKLVVDSDYHLYLDTFKVSSKLNDRIYRKYPISAEGNYPHDVMTVFSSLPKSELFKLPEDALNPHKFYSDYKNQYMTVYEYGAETNTDNLYSENMKILAPLHMGKHMPDFFCIFRYDGTYNEETYNSIDIDDNSKFTSLLKDSEVVKIFDLRNYTTIGQYLNNYKKIINDFLYGSCYMQFIEQDNEKYGENYRQGNNSWRGIDISKGIVTNKIETTYFANNVLSKESSVQETFNNYIIEGYERNNVLYPYILNLEFMFNDETSEDFSMHRYFGLYLSSNEFLKYDCIIKDNTKNNGVSQKLDADDNIIDDSGILDSIFVDKYADRIFFISTNNNSARIREHDDVKKFITEYVCDNPDKNVCNIKAEQINWHEDEQSFITMTFDAPIKYGEHLRFVALEYYNSFIKKNENICLEIVASNDKRLLKTDNFISPYINTNEPIVHECSVQDRVSNNNIYRLAFYSQSLSDETKPAELKEQFSRIKACIGKFDSFVIFESSNENTISFTSKHNNVYFQHIAQVNIQNSITYDKVFLTDSDGKYILNFTGKGNLSDYPKNYILDLKEALGDSCKDVLYKNNAYTVDDVFYNKDKTSGVVGTYVNYRDDDNNIDDTIHYFSKTFTSRMTPLSPDSYYYYNKYAVFSTFGYDILGWRYSNIVKFKNISDLGYSYTIYDDIENIVKTVRHPIVKTVEGTFETINKFFIDEFYLTDNILVELGVDKHSQKLVKKEKQYNIIVCPYNVDKSMLDFSIRPVIHNCEMNMYNPESAALSVMGIFNIKDIDMSINMNQSYNVKDTQEIKVLAGNVLYIDGRSDSRLSRNVLYCVLNGSFNEFGAYKFMIIGDTLYFTTKKYSNTVETGSLYNGSLTASTDMVISVIDNNIYQKYDFVCNIPTQNVDNYFLDPKSIVNSNLNISVVPQTNCLWESNGLYFDGNSVLNTDDMLNVPYKRHGYFTEHGFSPVLDSITNMFSKNSIDSWARIGENVYSFRDLIINSKIKNPIKKMLVLNNNIDTAVGYYNSYIQSLEFVYYGIKFQLKFDSEYYTQNLQMGQYNNFEIFIINDYDITKNNEIIISADEEIILIINHQFDMYNSQKKYTRIKNKNNDLTGYVDYSVRNAPYSIYSNSICGLENTMNAYKTSDVKITKYPYEENTYYVQEDKPLDIFKNNMSILPNYFYFNVEKMTENKNTISVKQDSNVKIGMLKKNSSGNPLYSVAQYPVSSAENLLNSLHRTEKSYIVSEHKNDARYKYDSDDILEKYIQSFNKGFDCHIINNGDCESITITDIYKPINVSMSVPNQIKYNFGYFTPRVYSIIDFKTNDYELAKTLNMSLLLANTKLKNVKRINTYTGNKVFNGKISVERNYFIVSNKSIFSSNWDKNYYRSYNSKNEEKFSNINGYIPGIENKSFFGSRCMTLKNNYILLDDFSSPRANGGAIVRTDSSHNTYSKNTTQCKITINITQSMYSLFQNNSAFISNWEGLNANQDTSMKNYIKNSISEIFNNQRTIEVELFGINDNSTESMQVDYNIIEDMTGWNKIENFKTEFNISNGDMIVTITMSENKHMIIHPQIKIYRN